MHGSDVSAKRLDPECFGLGLGKDDPLFEYSFSSLS